MNIIYMHLDFVHFCFFETDTETEAELCSVPFGIGHGIGLKKTIQTLQDYDRP